MPARTRRVACSAVIGKSSRLAVRPRATEDSTASKTLSVCAVRSARSVGEGLAG